MKKLLLALLLSFITIAGISQGLEYRGTDILIGKEIYKESDIPRLMEIFELCDKLNVYCKQNSKTLLLNLLLNSKILNSFLYMILLV